METVTWQSCITSFVSPVGTHRCDDTRAEKISLVIMTIMTGDMLPLSFVEAEGFHLTYRVGLDQGFPNFSARDPQNINARD